MPMRLPDLLRPLPDAAIHCLLSRAQLKDGWVEFTSRTIGGLHKGRAPPKHRKFIHVRLGTEEEHAERVRERVWNRENPRQLGAWHKTQAGVFAHRGGEVPEYLNESIAKANAYKPAPLPPKPPPKERARVFVEGIKHFWRGLPISVDPRKPQHPGSDAHLRPAKRVQRR